MSADDFDYEHANRWMQQDADGVMREKTAKPKRKTQAAYVQKLAVSMGGDAEKMAERIPEDTLRRLKNSVIEEPQADGTTKFKHDIGVREGVKSLLATDRAHAPIPPGSAPRVRDDAGKFSK